MDSKQHGHRVVELLQNMGLLQLDADLPIDVIIDKCWHNKYATVAELAAPTMVLLTEGTNEEGNIAEAISITRWAMDISRFVHELWFNLGGWRMFLRQGTNVVTNTELANGREPNGDSCNCVDPDHSAEDHLSKKKKI